MWQRPNFHKRPAKPANTPHSGGYLGFPRCARYSVPVLGNLKYCGDYAGTLMAGVVATSLHPLNLVHVAKLTQTFRGARIACASWHPLSTPLHHLHSTNPAECPCLHKRPSFSWISWIRLKRKSMGRGRDDKRMIGCQLRVGFYHTPNIAGATGYRMGDDGGYPRAVGDCFK